MPPKRPPPLEVAPVDRSREGVSITDTLTLVVRDEIGREMRVKDGVSHSPDAPVLNRIHYDDLRIGTVLGKGSQGKVRLVQHRQTKQIFAMKNIEYKGGSDAREARLALEAELRRVEALKHENIVTSHEAFFRSGQLCIILEYMDAGSMADVINRHVGGTPTAFLAYITRSLFRGLSHLHSQKVLHRDIKPANVLANSKAEIKITDFGISRSFSDQSLQTVTVFGSMPYLSPEMLQNEPYSFDCDVWSSGVTVAECALGKYPFNINKKGSVFEISETIVKGASAIDWSSIKEKHPDSLFDFIRLCLQPAKERPTSIQLMEHPFLKLADAANPADVGRWLVEGIPQKAPATKLHRLLMAASCVGEEACMASLKSIIGSDVTVFDHPEVKTVDEWTPELQKIGGAAANAAMAKNLFLKGKKGELCLVFALASTKTDLKIVGAAVGSAAMRFASEDNLKDTLGVVQGAVTPLALINDKEKKVIVALDSALQTLEGVVAVHPCRNDKTVLVTFKQLSEYITALGHTPVFVDFTAVPAPAAAAPAAKKPAPKKEAKKEVVKGETKLGLDVKKEDDFAAWYSQVITKAEMIEYYDVSGCYIIRPWAFQIWEEIKAFLAKKIRVMGVEDCYFPMFVTQSVLNKEKDHVEGFAPEVAWITKAGDAELANPIALRPTSETVMYPYFAKWIRSHRDLPLRLNQWCNVVRWEFSHPTPFIRTREFLWQEGHCAWATFDECEKEVRVVLNHYASVYEDLLAVPVVQGLKTEKERFAGGHSTTTVETFIAAVGRGCQGATSHNLGQNFGKMFDISFEDPSKSDGSKTIPFQNSWGLTTRTIGVMTMVHGDNVGLVLPPRVANVQVVIVPVGITSTTTPEGRQELFDACNALQDALQAGDIRAKADLRDNYSPAWRFNHWELKGVPIRIELGPKEVTSKKLMLCIRHNMERKSIEWADATLVTDIKSELDGIHDAMLTKARTARADQTKTIVDWTGFTPALNEKCLILAPWCGSMACEDRIKVDSADESKALIEGFEEDVKAPSMGAKSLCIPYAQPNEPAESHNCIRNGCTEKAQSWVLWGRSY